MRELVKHIMAALDGGLDSVLVTVVGSTGSTPRHVGSQMLVSSAGLVCGTIGGGAIEAHAIHEACAMVGQVCCRMEDMGLQKSLGMVCGGGASLLYTPVRAGDARWREVAETLLRCLDERTPACLVLGCHGGETFIDGAGVALVDEDGRLLAGDAGDSALSGSGFSGIRHGRIAGDCFIMPVPVPVRAVVFGAGHVGRATVGALSRVGFACTLFDCRPEFATSDGLPQHCEVVLGDYQEISASLALDERDYVLIMTHSHTSDFAVLEQVLRQLLAYVGLMGSHRKIAMARELMLQAGISQESLDRVHMPIGLDIQAETPEEIAVSVAAECILYRATHA